MVSKRTSRCENGNGQNLQGYFLSDGFTAILLDGDELGEIYPVWNWAKLPGVTVPQKKEIPRTPGFGKTRGQTLFVGGVSDGVHGVSVYDYHDREYGVLTSAKKYWFFTGSEIVCLGCGIESEASEEIVTTINQCRLSGRISKGFRGSDLKWVWHHRIGYYLPTSQKEVVVQGVNQSGSWWSIDSAMSKDIVTEEVFSMWIEHGVKPSKGSYAYVVVPNVSVESMEGYGSEVEIIRNDEEVQAVRQVKLDVWGIVFYSSGTLRHGEVELTVDVGCAILLGGVGSSEVRFDISDPSQISSEVNVKFRSSHVRESEFSVKLPDGPYAGSSARHVFNRRMFCHLVR
jgi:chondroitin AC lyase